MNIQSTMTAAFNQAINLLGMPAVLTPAKGGAPVSLASVGFASLGRQDEALVNAYGPAAKVITISAAQTTAVPAKFDTLTVLGVEKFVLAAVHPIHAGPTIIGWKCYSKQP
jgi:hypothetical protein